MSNEEKKVFMHERLCVSIEFGSVCVSVCSAGLRQERPDAVVC